MADRFDTIFTDARDNLRIKDKTTVLWNVPGSEHRGQGKVRNISTSGMLMETAMAINPEDQCIFSFDTALGDKNFIPRTGRIVWLKKKRLTKDRYLCGIKFVEPAEQILSNLRQRVQKGMLHFINIRRAKSVVNVLLVSALIGLTVFCLWLSSTIYRNMQISNQNMLSVAHQQVLLSKSYVTLYQDSQAQLTTVNKELNATTTLYQESQEMLRNVTQDLEATKAILVQTETLLSQAKAGNLELRGAIASLKDVNDKRVQEIKTEFDNTIALLQEKDIQLNDEMKKLNSQLRFYTGDIKSLREGKASLALHRDRIKLVKSKLKYYKQEALNAKIAALQEKDRVKLLIGNNGYFVKAGEVINVDLEKYQSATLDTPPGKSAAQTDRKVEVDVTFFE